MVRALRKRIRATHPRSRLMVEGDVEPGQVERPPSLPPMSPRLCPKDRSASVGCAGRGGSKADERRSRASGQIEEVEGQVSHRIDDTRLFL